MLYTICMAQDGSGIAWIVHTHEHKERTPDWYWGLGLLALASAGLSIFLGNILLAFILAIGATSIGTLAWRGPRTHWVRVDSRGISLDGTLYPYTSIHSFWVEQFNKDEGGQGRLLVSLQSYLNPQLVIPTEDTQRAANLRTYLRKYVLEEEQAPHLGEHLAEIVGL